MCKLLTRYRQLSSDGKILVWIIIYGLIAVAIVYSQPIPV